MQRDALLQKYNLLITDLDYGPIGECSDNQKLERIIKVLRSGEEGLYPDLIKFAEKRLNELKPESRLLREEKTALHPCDLSKDEQKQIQNEIKEWSTKVREQEAELTRYEVIRMPPPPVRKAAVIGAKESVITSGALPQDEKQELITKAQGHYERGDFLQASLCYQKVLSCDPLNAKARKGMDQIEKQSAP